MLADIFWFIILLAGAAAVPVVLHEVFTGLARFIRVRRRARIFRQLRDLRTVSFR